MLGGSSGHEASGGGSVQGSPAIAAARWEAVMCCASAAGRMIKAVTQARVRAKSGASMAVGVIDMIYAFGASLGSMRMLASLFLGGREKVAKDEEMVLMFGGPGWTRKMRKRKLSRHSSYELKRYNYLGLSFDFEQESTARVDGLRLAKARWPRLPKADPKTRIFLHVRLRTTFRFTFYHYLSRFLFLFLFHLFSFS